MSAYTCYTENNIGKISYYASPFCLHKQFNAVIIVIVDLRFWGKGDNSEKPLGIIWKNYYLSKKSVLRSKRDNTIFYVTGTEVAYSGVLSKMVLLKISQNSQENICVRVSFLIKLQPSTL